MLSYTTGHGSNTPATFTFDPSAHNTYTGSHGIEISTPKDRVELGNPSFWIHVSRDTVERQPHVLQLSEKRLPVFSISTKLIATQMATRQWNSELPGSDDPRHKEYRMMFAQTRLEHGLDHDVPLQEEPVFGIFTIVTEEGEDKRDIPQSFLLYRPSKSQYNIHQALSANNRPVLPEESAARRELDDMIRKYVLREDSAAVESAQQGRAFNNVP